jgi:hypothetical protein
MSTMGRQADEHARIVREIRKKAEKTARDYMEAWRTPQGVCVTKRGKAISLTQNETKRLAKVIGGDDDPR